LKEEFLALPDRLRGSAYVASNGELAWPRVEALEAAQWIAGKGLGILGGEVWQILGHGRWNGIIPSRGEPTPFVWGWTTEPGWAKGEPWATYVQRGLRHAVDALKNRHPEDNVSDSIKPLLRYNLTYCPEAEYPGKRT
jgi:hypothetical protein